MTMYFISKYLLHLLIVLSMTLVSQCQDETTADAFINTCDKVKNDQQAQKVLQCTSPPPEIRAFFKKCFQRMRQNAATKKGQKVNAQDEMSPLNELRLKCALMKMRRKAQQSSSTKATSRPKRQAKKDDKPTKEQQAKMNKETMQVCTPDDNLKKQMKTHYDSVHTKDGQAKMKQCLRSAIP